MSYTPLRPTNSPLASGPSATAAATRSASRCARRSTPVEIGPPARRAGRLWRQLPRQRPGARSTPPPPSATASSRDFSRRWTTTGLMVPMATTNLFTDPVFKDGAFTSHDRGCAPTRCRRRCARSTWASSWAREIYVFWGGREGAETDAAKDPRRSDQALSRRDRTSCATTRSDQGTTCGSRWSQAERAARRHLPADRRAACWPSSPRWTTPRWSASTPRSRTSTWPA